MQQGKYPNIDDIVIARDNKIVYEKYYNGQKREDLHDSRSSFKSITALLMGIAIDKGFIKSVKEKAYSFFPEYKSFKNWDARKKDMTIEDLLEMKSGFDCEEWEGTKDCEAAMEPTEDWVKFSLDLPLKYTPGTKWDYTSCCPMIISGIISNATKMPVTDFAAKYLFDPLGIKSYKWTKDKKGHAMTAGSFFISPIDYIKIGEMVLQKGSWNNKRVISEAWLNRSTDRITKIESFSNIGISRTKAAIPQPTWYGYYWYNEEINTGELKYNVVFASGNGGQYIMIIKDLQLVIVFNGNSYNSWKSKLQFELLAKYILPYFNERK